MIDTNKYEGHTEGPWIMFEQKRHINILNQLIGLRFVDMEIDSNAQLIADAPLLLEEVKATHAAMEKLEQAYLENSLHFAKEINRLHEAIADIANNMEAADDSYMGGFIEDLRKVIE